MKSVCRSSRVILRDIHAVADSLRRSVSRARELRREMAFGGAVGAQARAVWGNREFLIARDRKHLADLASEFRRVHGQGKVEALPLFSGRA